MRWLLLRPLTGALAWALGALDLLQACLGCVRFFLVSGASPRYILSRRGWFAGRMLGHPLTWRELLEFGSWHARSISRWRG